MMKFSQHFKVNKYLFFLLIPAIFTATCRSTKNTDLKVDTILKTSKSWNGQNLPAYPKGSPEITLLKITIPPKSTLPVHKHPVINTGFVLKGMLTVITELNDTLYLKEGEALSETVNTWHRGINDGNVPVEILVFYAGIEGMPISISK